MLLGLSGWAQDVDSNPVEFKFKVYLESEGKLVKKANNLNIRVDETFDHGFRDFKERPGKFSIDISANKQFIAFLSAD